MALRLSGLQNRAVVIAGWRFAYPAYRTVPWSLPDGAVLIRPKKPWRGHCRMALRLSGLQTVPWVLPGGDSLTRPTEHTSLS